MARIKFHEIEFFNIISYGISILKISRKSDESFNEATEEQLRLNLGSFENKTMSPYEERSIELSITGKPGSGFKRKVNFYFREGRIRKTPHSFHETIDDLVKWCKLLSTAIKQDTEK